MTLKPFRLNSRPQSPDGELPPSIQRILKDRNEGTETNLVRATITSLINLLAALPSLDNVDSSAAAIDEAARAFAPVREKAFELAMHLEDQVPLLDDTSYGPGNALLDVSFALRHELRRAFDLDILNLDDERPYESAAGRLARAHGMLQNCFRQCTVLLAQALDSSLDEREVFADAEARLEESIKLRDALSSLLASLKLANTKTFPQSVVSAIEPLENFRRTGLPLLMRRDWAMFDVWENDLVAAKDEEQFESTAKKTLVGLETLLAQVRMRSVFKGEPRRKRGIRFNFAIVHKLTSRMSPALWSAAAAGLVLACMLAFFVDTSVETRGSQFTPTVGAASTTIEPARFRTQPATASVQPATVAPAKVEAIAHESAVVEPANVEQKASPASTAQAPSPSADQKTSASGVTLQVAAFGDNAPAQESASRFKSLGVPVRVVTAQKNGQTIYRVQVGDFANNSEATTFGRQLISKGLTAAFIVTSTEPAQ